jgi:hypothetical protein
VQQLEAQRRVAFAAQDPTQSGSRIPFFERDLSPFYMAFNSLGKACQHYGWWPSFFKVYWFKCESLLKSPSQQ